MKPDNEKQRTIKQNASLHLYCKMMAEQMDNAGFDQVMVFDQFKDGFELPWTMESVKNLFRTVAIAMYPEISSTAELTTSQIQKVYEVVNMRLSEITGISVEFPSNEPPMIDWSDK